MKREELLIEPGELLARLGDPSLRILDATIIFSMNTSAGEGARMPSAHEIYLSEHVPGAAFFDHQLVTDPIGSYEYMLAPEDMQAREIGGIGIGNQDDVIVYASSLLASAARAWWVLRFAGVQEVRVLNGGLAAWKEAGGAVEPGERTYDPATFTAAFDRRMIADTAEVQSAVEQGGAYIEYALPQEWYGREHIPGSVCLPLTSLTIGWDTFRPQDEIEALIPGRPKGERVITYCEGGIAAALNAMAHLMAGNDNVAVYDGSLSEWKGEGLPVSSTTEA